MISGVCRWPPPTPYGAGVAHHLAAEQVRLGGLAGAAGAARRRPRRRRARPGRRRRRARGSAWRRSGSSRGRRSGVAPRELLALAGQLGQAVGPGAGVGAAVEPLPGRRVGEPEVGAAVDDDDVVAERGGELGRTGRAAAPRKTTSWPARVSGVVSSRTRSASGTRCGWRVPSGSPALEPPVSAPISTSGWASSRRRTSPPAYPLAPATATVYGHVHDYTDSCMFDRITGCVRRWPPARLTRMTTLAPDLPRPHPHRVARGSATCWPTATPRRGSPAAPTGTPPTCSGTSPGCSGSGPPSSGSGPRAPRSSRTPRRPETYAELLAAFDELLRRPGQRPRGGRPGRPGLDAGRPSRPSGSPTAARPTRR